ncbi:hypothetical protein ACH5RR_034176 [Cinchona calisaya]|uniref:Uncharacterized protein n=1 Tax=Cinchona calisaya TaxID=153742 RepID=A0ABD2YAY8_9GENT
MTHCISLPLPKSIFTPSPTAKTFNLADGVAKNHAGIAIQGSQDFSLIASLGQVIILVVAAPRIVLIACQTLAMVDDKFDEATTAEVVNVSTYTHGLVNPTLVQKHASTPIMHVASMFAEDHRIVAARDTSSVKPPTIAFTLDGGVVTASPKKERSLVKSKFIVEAQDRVDLVPDIVKSDMMMGVHFGITSYLPNHNSSLNEVIEDFCGTPNVVISPL